MSSEVPSVRKPAELPDGVSQATIGVRGGLLRSGFEETAEAMYLTSGYVYSSAAEAATEAGIVPSYNVLDGFEGNLDEQKHRGGTGWKAVGLPWKQS